MHKASNTSIEIFNLITSAVKDLIAMNQIPSLSELSERGFVVEAGLSISKNSSGGLTISVFGADAALDRTKDQGHSIKLTFKRKIETIKPQN